MKNITYEINRKLEIYIGDNIFQSSILDVTEDHIVINTPMSDGIYITPHIGDRLEVIYYGKINVYKFETVVLGRQVENNIPQILIHIPENPKKIQRRQFVRISITSYFKYLKVEHGATKKNLELKLRNNQGNKGVLLDLSGGGMKIKIDNIIKVKDKIAAIITIDGDEIFITGEILRINKDEDGKLICGVRFNDIDYRIREKIISSIFAIMRKQRKTI